MQKAGLHLCLLWSGFFTSMGSREQIMAFKEAVKARAIVMEEMVGKFLFGAVVEAEVEEGGKIHM